MTSDDATGSAGCSTYISRLLDVRFGPIGGGECRFHSEIAAAE
jgi:hypothetical protein